MITLWISHNRRYDIRPSVAAFLAARMNLVYDIAKGRGYECHLTRDSEATYLGVTAEATDLADMLAELEAIGMDALTLTGETARDREALAQLRLPEGAAVRMQLPREAA